LLGAAASLPGEHRLVRGRWTCGSPALQPPVRPADDSATLALTCWVSALGPAKGRGLAGGEGPSAGEVGSFGPAGDLAARLMLAPEGLSIRIQRGRRGPMFGCPRCGNDAVYLADEVFSLIRCEFCGDAIDADVLLQDVDHITRGLLPGSGEELLPPLEAEFV
jgi:hypothetical protein